VIDEEEDRIEVVVPDDQLSPRDRPSRPECPPRQPADRQGDRHPDRGRRIEKRQKEFAERTEMFQTELDVDETLAQLLVAEGFGALEEVAYVEADEIASIEGFDEDLAAELQSRATEALERREEANRTLRRELGVSGRSGDHAASERSDAGHAGQGRHSRRSTISPIWRPTNWSEEAPGTAPPREDENKRPEDKGGVLGEYGLSEEQGNEIIMAARAHWFDDEEAAPAADASEESEA
jgi:N utilization substance protein A